jgi:RNA polymerase sigma-70 factor (ECF subfamily)
VSLDLTRAFRAAVADRAAWDTTTDDALAPALADALAAARAAWPDITVEPERFVARLARHAADLGALRALRATDLYLACACAAGDATAISRFEEAYFPEVGFAAKRTRATDAQADEIRQRLRRVLFVAEGDRPAAIAEFAGRGDLRSWVRISATRDFIHMIRRDKREVHVGDDQNLLDLLVPEHDPELAYIGAMYRDAMTAAVRGAFTALEARQRRLLRLAILDGLTIDELGKLHGVHRATAARWLADARERVLELTRAALADTLGATSTEVDSIVRLVHGRVEVSLDRLLATR